MSLVSGQLDSIAPGVRRLVARNPGYMTGPGTNTYLVGNSAFAAIDPGPDDPVHVERILAETGGALETILATHTHPDHSPAARTLSQESGASVLGRPRAARRPAGCGIRSRARSRRRRHRACRRFPAARNTHARPCLESPVLPARRAGLLFTGDHLMQGSTVVIAPPDGNMNQYLASLARLQREPVTRIAPGHGLVIEDAQAEIARHHRASPAA